MATYIFHTPGSSLFSMGESEEPEKISASFSELSPLQTQRHRGILILLRVILYFSLCLCASVVKSFTHNKQRRA
jgi:hypothetical protein